MKSARRFAEKKLLPMGPVIIVAIEKANKTNYIDSSEVKFCLGFFFSLSLSLSLSLVTRSLLIDCQWYWLTTALAPPTVKCIAMLLPSNFSRTHVSSLSIPGRSSFSFLSRRYDVLGEHQADDVCRAEANRQSG